MTSKGSNGAAPPDPHPRRIREWLLLVLRFAITRELEDRHAVHAMADEIDALGLDWRPSAPSFFRRTSTELCDVIAMPDDATRTGVLRKHMNRVDDVRLRRALEAALGIDGPVAPCSAREHKRKRSDLWQGLRGS